MIVAEIPLYGNLDARARYRRAMLRRVQTMIEQDRLAQNIRQDVNDAVDQLERDWRRIQINQQAVDTSRKTYEAELRVHQNGQINATQLLDAARNLALAEAELIQSFADYRISKVALAVATGTMLGHGRVEWQGVDVLR